MSWSLPVGTVRPAGQISEAAQKTLAELRAKGPSWAGQFDAEETRDEVAEQVEAAVEAALDLLPGLGDPEEVTVNLYGHANPGHASRGGYANESITVSVTRATPAGGG